MSAYRPAHRIREGWQVFVLDEDGVWQPRTVVRVLRVYSPLKFVRLELDGGDFDVLAPSDEVRCRTLTEVRAATREAMAS